MATLRPDQHKILEYRSGKMGISAVPGSGKTWTLSRLAADLVSSGLLADDQEVLVVTLVNSAVDNFYQRVSEFIGERGLLPNLGYRVRTLHGLAHDIVRQRPALVGLEDHFQIIDEREGNAIRNEVAQTWLRSHPYALDDYIDPGLDDDRCDWVRREQLPDLVNDIALTLIRYAKDQRLTPERLQVRLGRLPMPLPLAEMGCDMYADYQRALNYRGAVDFDDLIRLALQALESDEAYLQRLQHQWPYILEDEAQDSSRLQEEILKTLSGKRGNWVRVGDPNQAIYETFTTASPHYLRSFIKTRGVKKHSLPNSGRSTQSIIDLANYLVQWAQSSHPVEAVRDALHSPPFIEPTPLNDPQPNPPDDPNQIHLFMQKLTPQEEIQIVADSLERWLPEHTDWTVAVLAPRNQRGVELENELRRRGLPYVASLLASSTSTRLSAGALANVLNYLSDPQSARKLSTVYRVWRRMESQDPALAEPIIRQAEILRRLPRVEDFLWPVPGQDWLQPAESGDDPGLAAGIVDPESLLRFRQLVRRWQAATLLPIDQLVLTLAQDLLSEPTELAIAHKLAVLLRQASQANPGWRLPELTEELAVIARNERRFIGFSTDDTGFDPDQHRGKVVVGTIHRAKGLEWDRVYLMSVNNYDFPSAQAGDLFISEKWFLAGLDLLGPDGLPVQARLNLGEEALAQLKVALSSGEHTWYRTGNATQTARLDYARERLRLLYVGITRAKRELVITWNSGRNGGQKPAAPLEELHRWWEARRQAGE
ncbi:MAG: ATP-dependent helicase [Anaerolineales bacterium]|nr:ATP-dependent helicase [Anaerolineales bacterium]